MEEKSEFQRRKRRPEIDGFMMLGFVNFRRRAWKVQSGGWQRR